MTTKNIIIEDYTYELPDERIAKYPLAQRDQSKLLVYQSGLISDRSFSDLPDLLPKGSLLVRNNSRVIRARLLFRKESGAQIEIFCLDPLSPNSYELALSARERCSWHCMLGNARRWHRDQPLALALQVEHREVVHLQAERTEEGIVHFSWDNPTYTFGELLELMGILPIPPYLNREAEQSDLQTYQTVYARPQGSVAAPTAGLHFTEEVFRKINERGVSVLDVTLHVGAGTFKPVKSKTIGEHEMHQELIVLERQTIECLYHHSDPIIAVGTTSVRTLESLYHLGVRLLQSPDIAVADLGVGQWQAYEYGHEKAPSAEQALRAILDYMDRNELETLVFPTAILIAPGYTFRMVSGIVTNFHQPNSTLLLLISAFISDDWRAVYDHALRHGYRFLSYGDSSLLLP
ncbi:MAG: S-adenosylmethionine:tRNA ribosyltransferase-isomerase [Porphyromonadaceae bacterium]|nr:S-adenosylmethionine:tRNA ribosyltransferase-isomerase [Porphyromonadaceae bacterium]